MITLLTMIAAMAAMQAPLKSDPAKLHTTPAAPKPPLDQVIAAAVRTNPDVKIAEAEVQLAQAKLNAVKVAAAQRVTVLNDTRLEAERAVATETNRVRNLVHSVENAAKAYDITEKRVAAGTASQNELSAAKSQVLAAEARVAEAKDSQIAAALRHHRIEVEWNRYRDQAEADAQSHSNLLLGAMTTTRDFSVTLATKEPSNFRSGNLLGLTATPKTSEENSAQRQLRAALDCNVRINEPLRGNIRVVAERLVNESGLSIRVKFPDAFDPKIVKDPAMISLDRGEMTLGAWLALFVDELADVEKNLPPNSNYRGKDRFDFYVRDYGLQLATRETAAPGAILLSEFWKIPIAKPAAVTAPAAKP